MEEEKLNKKKYVNDMSVEIIAKSIFRETSEAGFTQADYIKLANGLLDFSMNKNLTSIENEKPVEANYKTTALNELPLVGNNILIRKFEPKDEAFLNEWLLDDSGRNFLLTRTTSRNYTIENLIENQEHILGVITLHSGLPVGLMAFLDFDDTQKKAELRKIIGNSNYRGKGFGKEATKLWINYGVNGLLLKKIYLNTLNTNLRNIRINRELGFNVEGILQRECLIDGEFFDILRMALVVK